MIFAMGVDAHVEGAVSSLRRAYGPSTVLFETDDLDAGDWHEYFRAVPSDWGTAPFESLSLRAPTGWVGRFYGEWPQSPAGGPDPLLEWCRQGCARLDEAGYTGAIRAPQRLRIDQSLTSYRGMVAFSVGWRHDVDAIRRNDDWQVGPEHTAAMMDHFRRFHEHDDEQSVRFVADGAINSALEISGDNLFPDLELQLRFGFQAAITSYFGTETMRTRMSQLRRLGTAFYHQKQLTSETGRSFEFDRRPLVDWARNLMCEPAAHINYAAISVPGDDAGMMADYLANPGVVRPEPYGIATNVHKDFWMLEHWLADVSPVMVVTPHHLQRLAGRLDGWSVEPIGHDRYLLEADNLDDWYTNPDYHRYLAAYEQFEPAILKRSDARAFRQIYFAEWGIDRLN